MSLIVSRKKLQISDIEKELESQGYQMIENSFDPKSYKIDCLCPIGHVTRVCYYSWKKNVNKCSLCPKKEVMPLNITIDILRDIFNKFGFTLLSTQYDGSDKPLKYICSNGHETEMKFCNWKRSNLKCKECAIKNHIKTQKLPFEFVKNEFAERGYKLLSTDYKNAHSKLSFECDNGHIGFTTFNHFYNNNTNCFECAGSKKHTIEEMREFFSKQGYTLLSTEYKNSHSKLQYECPKGHIGEISYHNFDYGKMCAECAGTKKHTIEEVKEAFLKAKYTLLSTEYINSITKLKYECPLGHIGEISYDNFIRGHKCSKCAKNKKYTIEEVRKIFLTESYTLLSTEYTNCKTKLKCKCSLGHISEINFAKFVNGKRCGTCRETKGEQAIRKYLTELNLKFIQEKRFENCRNINALPFDFHVDNNFIIEYDGQQHFKPVKFFGGEKKFIECQQSDKIKTDYCKNNKLALLRISYDEFENIPKHINEFIELLKEDSNAIHFTNDKLYEYLK